MYETYSELLHVWRIPTLNFIESIEKGFLVVSIDNSREYTVENMKEYEITDLFRY